MPDRRKCLICRGWLTQLDTSTNNNNNHTHTPTPTYTRMYTQPSTKSTLSMLARTLCLPEWVEFLVEGRRNEASRKSRYARDTALYRNSTAAAHRKRRWITTEKMNTILKVNQFMKSSDCYHIHYTTDTSPYQLSKLPMLANSRPCTSPTATVSYPELVQLQQSLHEMFC